MAQVWSVPKISSGPMVGRDMFRVPRWVAAFVDRERGRVSGRVRGRARCGWSLWNVRGRREEAWESVMGKRGNS